MYLVLGQGEYFILRRGCVCPGYTLIYECAVRGGSGGATVWRGSAFDCPLNEITLLHSRFTSLNGTFGVCNNEAIVGMSLRAKDSCYTSQLTVKLSTDMVGESISCVHDDTSTNTAIGSTKIDIATG